MSATPFKIIPEESRLIVAFARGQRYAIDADEKEFSDYYYLSFARRTFGPAKAELGGALFELNEPQSLQMRAEIIVRRLQRAFQWWRLYKTPIILDADFLKPDHSMVVHAVEICGHFFSNREDVAIALTASILNLPKVQVQKAIANDNARANL